MLIIPAIDIIKGQCVRLFKGEYKEKTVFNKDPIIVAKEFEQEGATWLHVIDLEGAKDGHLVNKNIIKKILKNTDLKLQIGGGIRNVNTIQEMLEMGVTRIILGTMAIKNPEMVAYLKDEHNIISVDAKNGKVMIEGWLKKTNFKIMTLIKKFRDQGLSDFIYTDIEKDGTLTSPNFKIIKQIREKFPKINLIIAGGISRQQDLEKLAAMKINGAIVGKAMYTNKDLRKYVSQKNYTLS